MHHGGWFEIGGGGGDGGGDPGDGGGDPGGGGSTVPDGTPVAFYVYDNSASEYLFEGEMAGGEFNGTVGEGATLRIWWEDDKWLGAFYDGGELHMGYQRAGTSDIVPQNGMPSEWDWVPGSPPNDFEWYSLYS